MNHEAAIARYDHSELADLMTCTEYRNESSWQDLPVGSFSASGTNVPTTMLRLVKPR
jgi:hypothetical protein